MNCKQTQTAIDSYIDGDLPAKDSLAVELHIKQCAGCRQSLDDAKEIKRMLSSLPVDPPSDNFDEKVFKHVRQQYANKTASTKGSNNFITGFATAIAASLVIWIANIVFISPDNTDKAPVITVAMNKVETIRLMLGSETDVKQVTLSLGLPDNIRLKGYESKDKLVWKTSLSKGDNVLSLPVKAIARGQGNLIAQVRYGNKTKSFRILVKTYRDTIRGDVLIKQINFSKFV